jgi:hypothetical protein
MSRRLLVRLLAAVTACLLAVVVLEVASFVLFYATAGRLFSYRRVAEERAAEVRAWMTPSAAPTPAPRVTAAEGRPEHTPVDLVPHPFMGFVYDPESPRLLAAQGRGALPLTDHGFFSLPPPPPGKGEELSVGVFGGSVAAYFSVDGREAMTRVLHADPALRSKRVRVYSVALGGFKQPQMMAALAYLMAQGQYFDVVVELDGFNEVAISFLDYKKSGTFLAYPRDWYGLVGETANVHRQEAVGKITLLKEWRGMTAAWFSRRTLSWSITAALIWKSLDKLINGELTRAREELAAVEGGGRYRDRGPRRNYTNDQELLAEIAVLWGRSSLQMQRLCAGAGTHYHHFLQPNQYFPGSKPMGQAEKAVAYRADHAYRLPVEVGYPMLRAQGLRLTGLGVDFHDLTQLYAGVSEPIYVDDCCHVNLKGNALMGEAVGRAVVAGWKR